MVFNPTPGGYVKIRWNSHAFCLKLLELPISNCIAADCRKCDLIECNLNIYLYIILMWWNITQEFDAVEIVFIDLHHFEFDHRRMKKATSAVGAIDLHSSTSIQTKLQKSRNDDVTGKNWQSSLFFF